MHGQNSQKFSPKISPKIIFLQIPDCYKQFCNIDEYLEFKGSFGKYHPVFPKNP